VSGWACSTPEFAAAASAAVLLAVCLGILRLCRRVGSHAEFLFVLGHIVIALGFLVITLVILMRMLS
jgi:hypothetical protein